MANNSFDKIYTINPKRVPWGYKNADPDFIYTIEKLQLSSNTKILDMGCGNGKNTTYLKASKFEIHAFDISRKAISVVKKRLPSANFVVADAAHLPYTNKYFDVALDWGLFHCIPPQKRKYVKEEILRVLKKGGHYIMRVFFTPSGHPARDPLFYENLDQTGRSIKQDLSRQQFPVWGLNFRQISQIFSRDFIIKNKFYFGNRIIVAMLKK